MLNHHVNWAARCCAVAVALALTTPVLAASVPSSGVVSAVSGSVKIRTKDSVKVVSVGQSVEETDRLETGAGAMVQVRYGTGDSFTVYEKASVQVSEYRILQGKTDVVQSAVDVAYGKLRFFVNPQGKFKKKVQYRSKSAVMGIRGTSGVIDVDRSGSTQLHVITGKVEVFNPKFPDVKVPVEALKMTRIDSAKAPTPPSAVTAVTLQGLVPPAPAGAGFSDDSAKASDAYQGLAPQPQEAPASKDQQSKPPLGGQDEQQDDVRDEERNDLRDEKQGGDRGRSEPSSAKPGDSEQKEPPARELNQGSKKPNPARRVRSKVTVFNPGGDVVQTDAPPQVKLKAAPDSLRRSEPEQETVAGTEQDATADALNTKTATDIQTEPVESLRRVSTEVERVVTTTNRIVDLEKTQTTKPTPEARGVIIKIPLPRD